MTRNAVIAATVAGIVGFGVVACSDQQAAPTEEPPEVSSAPPSAQPDEAQAPESEEPEAEPEPTGPPKRIFAKKFVVPVRAAPSREAERIGYLRAGAVLMAKTAEPVGRERCRGGWYELTTGGFVCNVAHVIAFEGERLPAIRGRQPSREDVLPYEYGFVRRPVPMYKRLPTDEEAAQYEGYRIPGQPETPDPADTQGDGEVDLGTMALAMSSESEMAASMAAVANMSAMAATANMGSAGPVMNEAAMEAMAAMDTAPMAGASSMSDGMAQAPADEGDEDEEDQITLNSLQGEEDSVVMRQMMRGFYVSLDRDFRRGGRRYWRTQANGFVPYTAVVRRSGSEFAGQALSEELQLPVGWTLSSQVRAYAQRDNGSFRGARPPGYHHFFPVLAEAEHGGRTYYQGSEEQWFRDRDIRLIRVRERPSRIGETDKWIDIDLETQSLVAYEGDRPVYATLISSGKPDRSNDPERESFETISGLFRVKSKHLTDTMDGDTVIDGPYSVDDVPYVMYFELAFALHSAFWHNAFGRPKSHGCVNLSPEDAKWIFNWADPPLPEGWHSVYPSEDVPGTWINIHGDTRASR